MPAETRIRGEGSLKIDATVAAQCFQIRARERFRKKVERQIFTAMRVYRETAAIDRHTLAGVNPIRDLWSGDLQLRAVFGRANREHAADFFDQSGKHSAVSAVVFAKCN